MWRAPGGAANGSDDVLTMVNDNYGSQILIEVNGTGSTGGKTANNIARRGIADASSNDNGGGPGDEGGNNNGVQMLTDLGPTVAFRHHGIRGAEGVALVRTLGVAVVPWDDVVPQQRSRTSACVELLSLAVSVVSTPRPPLPVPGF
jgi:hypothetical protein